MSAVSSKHWYAKNKQKVLSEKKQYYVVNRAVMLEKKKLAYRKRRRSVSEQYFSDKEAAINVYTNGEGTCRHCGQGDIDVLCRDHVNDDGADHRRAVGKSIYKWVHRNDYPLIFQVLCYNCNMKKEMLQRRAAWTN